MQVMLEVTVVAQTLHLEQVTNNRFRNHLGSFFSDKKTSRQKLLVFLLLFQLSLLKLDEENSIMNLGHRDYGHVNLFHVVLGVVFLV